MDLEYFLHVRSRLFAAIWFAAAAAIPSSWIYVSIGGTKSWIDFIQIVWLYLVLPIICGGIMGYFYGYGIIVESDRENWLWSGFEGFLVAVFGIILFSILYSISSYLFSAVRYPAGFDLIRIVKSLYGMAFLAGYFSVTAFGVEIASVSVLGGIALHLLAWEYSDIRREENPMNQ